MVAVAEIGKAWGEAGLGVGIHRVHFELWTVALVFALTMRFHICHVLSIFILTRQNG